MNTPIRPVYQTVCFAPQVPGGGQASRRRAAAAAHRSGGNHLPRRARDEAREGRGGCAKPWVEQIGRVQLEHRRKPDTSSAKKDDVSTHVGDLEPRTAKLCFNEMLVLLGFHVGFISCA